ncbi:hypothetical protein B0T14DRAFT_562604 [Immersiella caudata]|uniref:DUF6594 domain-containing protein n=1 Tax=Immersiella caudata TaxID=314043 RepID=A0AA40C604_9PEZI|nr:hypothetical protein B0T14DRAFT_562604 [Immersiella caudata]
MPDRIDGTDVIRNFNVLGMRLMQYTGGRLAVLQQLLDEFDKEQNGIQNLTKYQMRLPGQLCEKGYYDMLVREMRTEYREYGELVRHYKEIGQLHPLSYRRVKQVFRLFLKTGLEYASLLWINTPHEAVSFSAQPPCLMVWFADTWLGELVLGAVATSHHPVDESGLKSGFIRLSVTTILHRGSTILFALAILIPTGILFLCELNRTSAYAVVVVSTLVFSLQINMEDRNKTLYAVCALSAVLVTVMSQMAGVSPEP